ncbi:hypothetical protein [Lacinutrix sp. Hel_I_90]|nr:hypothetical protein [Lacinutrix sp. Hel_I_90]
MDSKNKMPKQNKQDKQAQAINKKGVPTDGEEINHQIKDKKEVHQPRDNA